MHGATSFRHWAQWKLGAWYAGGSREVHAYMPKLITNTFVLFRQDWVDEQCKFANLSPQAAEAGMYVQVSSA